MSDAAANTERKTSTAVLYGILSMFIVGLIVEISTLFVWEDFSTGGLLTWVIGIVLAVLWKRGSINISTMLYYSWILGMLLGLIVCIATGFYYAEMLPDLVSYSQSMTGLYWRMCRGFFEGMLVLTGSEPLFSQNSMDALGFLCVYIGFFLAVGYALSWILLYASKGKINIFDRWL